MLTIAALFAYWIRNYIEGAFTGTGELIDIFRNFNPFKVLPAGTSISGSGLVLSALVSCLGAVLLAAAIGGLPIVQSIWNGTSKERSYIRYRTKALISAGIGLAAALTEVALGRFNGIINHLTRASQVAFHYAGDSWLANIGRVILDRNFGGVILTTLSAVVGFSVGYLLGWLRDEAPDAVANQMDKYISEEKTRAEFGDDSTLQGFLIKVGLINEEKLINQEILTELSDYLFRAYYQLPAAYRNSLDQQAQQNGPVAPIDPAQFLFRQNLDNLFRQNFDDLGLPNKFRRAGVTRKDLRDGQKTLEQTIRSGASQVAGAVDDASQANVAGQAQAATNITGAVDGGTERVVKTLGPNPRARGRGGPRVPRSKTRRWGKNPRPRA